MSDRDPLVFSVNGACVGQDPDDYFYEQELLFTRNSSAEKKHIAKLRARCVNDCEALHECRDYVNKTRERFGFWAGETRSERDQRWRSEARLRQEVQAS